eukprot:1513746-Rhodomonas_salina.1
MQRRAEQTDGLNASFLPCERDNERMQSFSRILRAREAASAEWQAKSAEGNRIHITVGLIISWRN